MGKKFLIIFVFVLLLSLMWGWMLVRSVGDEVIQVQGGQLTIEQGMTAYGLHRTLSLKSPNMMYRLWLKKHYPDTTLKAGSYPIEESTTVDDLFAIVFLYEPQAKDISFTILPGWHIAEVQNTLYKAGLGNTLVEEESTILARLEPDYPFLSGASTLEGFLYPDTYRVFPDSDIDGVVRTMLDRFDELIYSKYSRSTGALGFYDTLILASIVEEEEKNKDNKPTVAGILKKRLDQGWYLGVDAAVCYEKRIFGDRCQQFVNDYYSMSQAKKQELGYTYDTRMVLGLPPTPISSVSFDTFEATVEHKESPYYYYLHDRKGQIHYARDGAGHTENKRKYLR